LFYFFAGFIHYTNNNLEVHIYTLVSDFLHKLGNNAVQIFGGTLLSSDYQLDNSGHLEYCSLSDRIEQILETFDFFIKYLQ